MDFFYSTKSGKIFAKSYINTNNNWQSKNIINIIKNYKIVNTLNWYSLLAKPNLQKKKEQNWHDRLWQITNDTYSIRALKCQNFAFIVALHAKS